MPSWEEIQSFAREHFKLTEDEGGYFATEIKFQDNRKQRVSVTYFEIDRVGYVQIRSRVCREEELDHQWALEQNADLVIGAYALEQGTYFVSRTVASYSLFLDEFECMVLNIAAYADDVEAARTAGLDRY